MKIMSSSEELIKTIEERLEDACSSIYQRNGRIHAHEEIHKAHDLLNELKNNLARATCEVDEDIQRARYEWKGSIIRQPST